MSQPGVGGGSSTQGKERQHLQKPSVAEKTPGQKDMKIGICFSHIMRFQKTMYLVVTLTPLTLRL